MNPAPARSVPASTRSATAKAVALTFVALLFAGFCALGIWQIKRLHWKHALIARVESRIHAPASTAPGRPRWPAVHAATDAYRRIFAEGQYLQGKDTRVQALTELGAGFWVLSPLRTADGIVLINRGFVPTDALDKITPPPTGKTRVEGLLRMDEPGGIPLRRNVPAQHRWFSRDLQAIASSHGLPPVAPYFIDATATDTASGWPRGGMTVVKFRDHHLQYALTWFALALLCAFAIWRLLSDTVHTRPREHTPHAGLDRPD